MQKGSMFKIHIWKIQLKKQSDALFSSKLPYKIKPNTMKLFNLNYLIFEIYKENHFSLTWNLFDCISKNATYENSLI